MTGWNLDKSDLTGGDLSGPYNNAKVVGLNGNPLGDTTPSPGLLLISDNSTWVAHQLYNDGEITGVTVSGGLLLITAFPGYIYGLRLSYQSSTGITIATGYARDSSNNTTIINTSPVTVSTGSVGSLGLDKTAISGTVATNTANATVTGTSTSFLTAFTTRSCSGTITGASTTITGTSTAFLSEFAVGDLIGTNSVGYSRITAIASDTSLTIVSAIPGGSPAGGTPVCIENAWLQVNSQTVQQINTITSNTTLTLAANSSATVASGGTCYIGALSPSPQTYLMVWLGQGASGTTAYFSTQRTAPFGVTGYNTYVRRIGSCLWNGNIQQFKQWGTGVDRWYQTILTSVLSGGNATTFTSVVCSAAAPPTATALFMLLVMNGPSTLTTMFVGPRDGVSLGGTTGIQGGRVTAASGAVAQDIQLINCDGAQAIAYMQNAAGGTASNMSVGGYQESL